MFKCFKMQITTGFKFSLPPLVKTKGKVGLPKSTELQLVFLGPGPSRHRSRKEVGLLMAPSQIDREPPGLRGRAKPGPRGGPVARAGRSQGRKVVWEEGLLSHFCPQSSGEAGRPNREQPPLYKWQGFPTPGVWWGWGA